MQDVQGLPENAMLGVEMLENRCDTSGGTKRVLSILRGPRRRVLSSSCRCGGKGCWPLEATSHAPPWTRHALEFIPGRWSSRLSCFHGRSIRKPSGSPWVCCLFTRKIQVWQLASFLCKPFPLSLAFLGANLLISPFYWLHFVFSIFREGYYSAWQNKHIWNECIFLNSLPPLPPWLPSTVKALWEKKKILPSEFWCNHYIMIAIGICIISYSFWKKIFFY